MNYYIGANGVLRVNKSNFHFPVSGFKANESDCQFNEPTWIYNKDIKPYIDPNFIDGYRPFKGARLI